MQHNILLIYPPDREEATMPETPPLGLAYLASFIRERLGGECNISILDLNLKRIDKEQFKQTLFRLREKPDIIGIGGIVTVFNHFLWMSKACRDIFPGSLLVAGGSLASTVPHLLFEYSPVDVCVKGEGELTFLDIINTFNRGAGKKDMGNIKGIFLWDDKKQAPLKTPERESISDLDTLGMPAYDLLDMEAYAVNGIKKFKRGYFKDLPSDVLVPSNRHMTVTSSRGCTGHCTFCYRQFARIGMNSPEFVKKHIMFLNETYGINVISFIDELFNISENRLDKMCASLEAVKERIPDFYFRIAAARADVINTDFLRRLKKTGCFQIIYGLESGSDSMLLAMKKKITAEENKRAVLAAKDAGLHCVPQFIMGLPGEDKNTFRETIDFIKSVDFWSTISIHKANAYPGSELYEYAKEKGLINDEFAYVSSLGSTGEYPLALADISMSEMTKMLRPYTLKREVRVIFRNNNFFIAPLKLAAWVIKKLAGKVFLKSRKRGQKCQYL